MEFLSWGSDPWGQEVLIRISWNLLYLAAGSGILFVIAHSMYLAWFAPKRKYGLFDQESDSIQTANVPERVARHSLASRLFHWVMAATMLVLLFTGFLPVIGVQFAWVTIHWVAGVVLTLSIVFHIIHSTFWMDLWTMWISGRDITEAINRFKRSLGQTAPAPRKHAKYPLENRLYHHAILVTGGMVICTRILMMFRIETPLWARDPYLFTPQTWGMIYVLHGLSAVSLVTLIIAHIYFGLRPEKRFLTWSMINGWIGRDHFVEHHDPNQWNPTQHPESQSNNAPSTQAPESR